MTVGHHRSRVPAVAAVPLGTPLTVATPSPTEAV